MNSYSPIKFQVLLCAVLITMSGCQTAPNESQWHRYRVQDGDTPEQIAQAYREQGVRVTVDQIKAENSIAFYRTNLSPGNTLFIPDPNYRKHRPEKHVTIPNKYFMCSFDRSPFVNPGMIQDLSALISDSGDQIVAINVLKSQDSNRYFGDAQVFKVDGENPFISIDSTNVVDGETNLSSFGYQYVGKTCSGIYVLLASDWQGGSGIFKSLLLVKFEFDEEIVCDWDKNIIRSSDRRRLLIKKLGGIQLGDRWNGELKVKGDSIFIGKDKGWFSVTGGTGGGYNTNVIILKVDLKR